MRIYSVLAVLRARRIRSLLPPFSIIIRSIHLVRAGQQETPVGQFKIMHGHNGIEILQLASKSRTQLLIERDFNLQNIRKKRRK